MPHAETGDASSPSIRARTAFAERRWADALALFAEADAGGTLTADDLDSYGEVAWWTGRLGDVIAARERAYAAHLAAGDASRAAAAALNLSADYSHLLESGVASGWVRRAERLLEPLPPSRQHGYLERAHLNTALHHGALDQALEHADRSLELGRRLADPDLEALGLQDRGRVLVALGRVEEGMALLDEAVVAAVGGQVSPYATAVVYCNATIACEDLTDYRRASEFADAARRWCERQTISGFPGMCRVRRVEIIRLRGAWAEAEAEARRACDELQDFSLAYAGEGFYQLGEIRLRVGDLAGAEDALTRAHELGRDPLPGLATLRHAEGRTEAAGVLLARALTDPALQPLARARLLPAEVEIGLALGDRRRAEAATTELEKIATQYGTHVLVAAAACGRGLVALATGEFEGAIAALRRGLRAWQETGAPYEAAQTRVGLAQAYLAANDPDAAARELNAAEAAFAQLGAGLDLKRVTSLRDRKPSEVRPASGRRAVRTFMFTDIVGSTNLIEAVGDVAWGRLLAWHDETIRSLLREHGGEEIHHAGDGFFVAFADADTAVTCALDIRATLTTHRERHGFAPALRIGLHSAEALETTTGYEGRGVHAAARIAGLGAADEIVVSRAVFDASAGPVDHGPYRTERLKGIADPVEVALLLTS